MDKAIIDISLNKDMNCTSAEQFLNCYFHHSYRQTALLAQNFEVLSFNNTNFKQRLNYQGIQWHFTNLSNPLNLYRLAKLISRKNKPVIYFHGFAAPVAAAFLRLFVSKKTKVAVQHHAEKVVTNPFKRWVQKLAYSNAHAYLFASKKLAGDYVAAGIIKDTSGIYEVMEGSTLFSKQNRQQAREKLGIGPGPVFLWVGRLNANKDPLTVLKAFSAYQHQGNHFKLYMIYADCSLEEGVKDYILKNNLAESVSLIGKIPHNEVETWYNAANYYVSASHYEGSGYALCEAMACGCVPIVTNIASFNTITVNGACAFLYQPANPTDLLEKLNRLNDSSMDELSQKAQEQFKAHLSFEAIAGKTAGIVKSLFNDKF